jgi:chromosome segregation ATPase
MEDLDFILQSKDKIKSLRSENETLKNDLVKSNREIDRLENKLSEAKQEIARLNNELKKANNEIAKGNNLIDEANAVIDKRNKVINDVIDIVYDNKYEEWASSDLRYMIRTDFEEFLRRLKSVLKAFE